MDADQNDGQAGRGRKPTLSTWRHASDPWTVCYTSPDGVAACRYFLNSLREALPDANQVRDALAFAELLMLHPDPPADHVRLHQVLWAAATVDESNPELAANRLNDLADSVLEESDHTASGQVFELGLTALAVPFHDRPSRRMRCIELGLLFGGMALPKLDDHTPSWIADGSPCFISPGILRPWIAGHIEVICDMAVQKPTGTHSGVEGWSCHEDEYALLALRMSYCILGAPLWRSADDDEHVDLRQDFLDVGRTVWTGLEASLMRRPSKAVGRCMPLTEREWHQQAQQAVLRLIQEAGTAKANSAAQAEPGRGIEEPRLQIDSRPAPTLTICRRPIVKSSDRYDKEEIARHRVLEAPLPLTVMPVPADVQATRARLLGEFPWAESVLDAIFNELMGRAQLGVQVLGMPATLLVGAPGSGKSRLARRIAEELGIPRLDLALAGTSDTKVLGGTSRGWSNGKPNDLATLLATRESASAIVMLDEIDKAFDHQREGGGIQSYLLGLLEPETACRHVDVFLKTECDFSGVLWIATANRLSSIQAPLVSRLRVLMLGQPRPEHYPAIAENVLAEMAKRWGLDRQVLPLVQELELPFDRLISVRQVRIATEAAVTVWARDLQRH